MKADKLIRDPLFPITEDTDPNPLFLVYTDEDYPTEENRDLLRRCVVNQVHAHLVCDLHRQRFDEVYERSAESLLIDMTEGLYQYLGRKRQKAMRRLMTENVFRRIVDFSKDRFPGITARREVLKIAFTEEAAKVSFLDWLEDFRRTAFPTTRPTEQSLPLFEALENTEEAGGEE